MSTDPPRPFTAILNPAARHGRLADDEARIVRAFDAAGLDVELVVTERPRHAVEIARAASTRGRAVIAVGGDGTVHEVARGLLDLPDAQPMGVLPFGTGNDFARMLGMSKDLTTAVAQIRDGFVQSVDIGRVIFEEDDIRKETVFINSAGIGFDGFVATLAPRYKGYPFGTGYLVSILVSLLAWKSARAEVIDLAISAHPVFNDPVFFMTVGNARDTGGGYTINPKASIVDGKLDICLVHAVSRLRALRMLPSAKNGAHLALKEVRYWHSERVRFTPEIPMPLHTDGEVQSNAVQSLELSVDPGALALIVPEAARSRL